MENKTYGAGYHFKMTDNDETIFEGDLHRRRCRGTTAKHAMCKRQLFLGLPYCYQHMQSILHLKVKPSTIEGAGKGLFANNGSANNDIVFRPGDTICKYASEHIDEEELNDRYGDYTGPYAIQIRNNYLEDKFLKNKKL